MHTFIPTKDELEEIIQKAVEKTVSDKLPEIIKKTNRKDYYTIEETCEILDVSRRHLQYLRDTEQISYVKNGRKIYFKAEDLDEFFNVNYIAAEV
ncbi:DNA binding domain-containing protein, excisionase family [Fodinibius roseus]|uniref:DNA binding domain-containing protein, excisionase family n=1 Tax=Fodinibius roseus TaxID=1194090 RepID=A0A1M5K1Y3_9BACT|nr:helix-turn-helix domain-containing protein [Fodinibius roseus]SHG46323.1 DNA binding domain-containing protein, excisionase family [Fodinibius roseus]